MKPTPEVLKERERFVELMEVMTETTIEKKMEKRAKNLRYHHLNFDEIRDLIKRILWYVDNPNYKRTTKSKEKPQEEVN